MNLVRHTHTEQVGSSSTRLAEQKEEQQWMEVHLVPGLDHLLRVGEKRHKLVGILNLDGCAARLRHLLRLQPLEEGQTASMSLIIIIIHRAEDSQNSRKNQSNDLKILPTGKK